VFALGAWHLGQITHTHTKMTFAMTMRLLLLGPLLVLTTLFPTTLATTSTSTTDDDVSIQQSLVDWIRSEGGYFNEKQVFRRRDASSPFGIFAAQRIEKGEVLTSVPWKCILTAGTDDFETGLHCDTTNMLIQEMKQNNKDSNFAPYIYYLQNRPPVDIPSTWSEGGRDLLHKIVLNGQLPPKYATSWVYQDWKQDCRGSMDPESIQAAMLLLSRGDDDMMIPIYDLYNHRNGKWHNTHNTVEEHVKHQISASRTIEAGEEIYNSYNHCTNCYNRYMSYATPEIFRDYGFVEQFPQRWMFLKHDIAFDLHENDKGDLVLQWLDYPPFSDRFQVTESAIDFFSYQYKRLVKLNQTDLQPLVQGTANYTVPPSELENVMQYYNALTTALDMAIKAAQTYDFVTFHDNHNDDDDDDEEDSVATLKEDTSLPQGVVDWIRKHGGYFNRKQEFRREKPADSSLLFGIFAKSKIAKGEKLLSVPWELVMTAGTDEDDGTFYCGTSHLIAEEIKLGDKSFFGPYVKYLSAAPPVNIPSTWSIKGKNLLRHVIQNGRVPPKRLVAWVDDWKEDCNINDNIDPVELQAAMQLVTRGDDDMLTPVYDMYNHRNGKWFNAQSYLKVEHKHDIVAYRNIQKGEQIYISYNQCANCFNRHYNFGTPEILRDYGFVEPYPQRWVFHSQEIAFDIVEKKSGDLELYWLDGRLDPHFDEWFEVTEAGINFLKSQLRRLKTLNETVMQPVLEEMVSGEELVPRSEMDTIMNYYNALTTAIEMAVESSKTYEYESPEHFHQGHYEDEAVAPPKETEESEYRWEENDDLDDDEEDDDDDDDADWESDEDCPGGMFVKGKCVTKIKKWEEL